MTRPSLRIVRDGDASPVDAPVTDALVGTERLAFEAAVRDVTSTDARAARRLASAGLLLASGALDLRDATARHAPERFKRGVTPGENSAKASRVLLETLLGDVDRGSYEPAAVSFAVVDAAEEVDRAAEVAHSVGFDSTASRTRLYRSATSVIRSPGATGGAASPRRGLHAAHREGLSILAAAPRARLGDSPSPSPVVAGIVGGVVGALIVAALLA